MRLVRYEVAMSLDGYIAGPHGEADWIISDPEIDAEAYSTFREFDTLLIGRNTHEWMLSHGSATIPGMRIVVFSTTLTAADHPDIEIVSANVEERVTALKEESGKDIWLFGGGVLFRTLLEAGLVDTVELAVVPVLLGGGIPLLPATADQTRLQLREHRVYKSGILRLKYEVLRKG